MKKTIFIVVVLCNILAFLAYISYTPVAKHNDLIKIEALNLNEFSHDSYILGQAD